MQGLGYEFFKQQWPFITKSQMREHYLKLAIKRPLLIINWR
ncbi:hypothetical protein SAMN05518684_107114 [Salipaludibacillus aurantiacus]|uniref:Uncharacterized protein n=1 Tax=Salipaludibacillus aurantiacus TaxID=1601833 RepID=A0A1H9UBM9_9BACI|nr:hypothetical protein SAMN05518684_107114 [Salipaludibacillus aurantiacus]